MHKGFVNFIRRITDGIIPSTGPPTNIQLWFTRPTLHWVLKLALWMLGHGFFTFHSTIPHMDQQPFLQPIADLAKGLFTKTW